MKKNPKFLDFDAIYGRKALSDIVEEIKPENTCLVLNNGDGDPDDSYSIVSYEKGFTFILYLERLVGTPEFEIFFQAYVAKFASKTVTSAGFKDFFLQHFQGNSKIEEIEWDVWYHAQGMPPILPPLDQSMAKASIDLANAWCNIDCEATSVPSTNEMSTWASGQITCFLDTLQVKTGEKALKISTLKAMNELYSLAETRNSEILFRYCQLAIASEDESIVPIAVRFITSQGRMKYIRPLYKSLYRSNIGKDVAIATFLKNRDIYHPIAAKMIAIDLKVAMEEESSSNTNASLLIGVAIVVVGIAIGLARRSRK
jgi:leukotriene-A4 hydrolase